MGTKLAMMFVHGVEIDDPEFAATASERLRQAWKALTTEKAGAGAQRV